MNKFLCAAAAVICLLSISFAGEKRKATWWDGTDWSKPVVYPFDKATLPFKVADHIKAVQIKGVDFNGKPSKFFCWYGVPAVKKGETVPGIVLVHGGGGFAFAKWVELWNSRGYAAIALDTCGNIPQDSWSNKKKKPVRNPENGATEAEKYRVNIPKEDQWSYQAVAEIMLAHSFLRSLEGVDKSKVGVTGVSWGGYLTTLVTGVDDRFAFSIPVYGCGFFDGTYFKKAMAKRKRTPEQFETWCKNWDADLFLSNAKIPVLFANGPDDHFFYLDSWVKTASIPSNAYMALRVKMGHSHAQADVPVVRAFADMVCKGGAPLPKLVSEGVKDRVAYAEFESKEPVISAEYHYSQSAVSSPKRKWTSVNLKVSGSGKVRVEQKVPEDAAIGYFTVNVKNNYRKEFGLARKYNTLPVFVSSTPQYYNKGK
ncbi:MAG: acetylxylan esterase [Lentisphaeria bacterium]|nr:acetylxylan esterase [Lentisphaeria bacterium]